MTQVLLIVGVIVFFITVCGAIMVGGHLLEELANAELASADPSLEPAPVAVGAARPAALSTLST